MVLGRGEKSLLRDPGSELQLEGERRGEDNKLGDEKKVVVSTKMLCVYARQNKDPYLYGILCIQNV